MSKIIFFSCNLCIGGMEKALVTLINSIDTKKDEVTLVLEHKEGELCKELNKNVKIVDYDLSSNRNIIIRRFINLVKKIKFVIQNYHKYDCAISYATYSVLSSQMARKCSKNSIIFIHSDYYSLYNGEEEKIREFFQEIQADKFNKIIFVSKESREKLIKVIPEIKAKSLVLGNLVDYKNIIELANKEEIKMNDKKNNIVFVGRLDDHSKNISQLIEKINNNKEKDKFNLYIVGTGPDEIKLKKLCKSSNIIFLGEKENPYPYIKASDYLILSSKYEGFPMVYSEATLLDTKIITTVPVEDEQICYNGKNVIRLEKDLSNFDEIISGIVKHKMDSEVPKMDFEVINKNKMKIFKKIVTNK